MVSSTTNNNISAEAERRMCFGYLAEELRAAFDEMQQSRQEIPVWGKGHWKNPFRVTVPAEKEDVCVAAIRFFLADNPQTFRGDGETLIITRGYQA